MKSNSNSGGNNNNNKIWGKNETVREKKADDIKNRISGNIVPEIAYSKISSKSTVEDGIVAVI